jgi:hypothetical protein
VDALSAWAPVPPPVAARFALFPHEADAAQPRAHQDRAVLGLAPLRAHQDTVEAGSTRCWCALALIDQNWSHR